MKNSPDKTAQPNRRDGDDAIGTREGDDPRQNDPARPEQTPPGGQPDPNRSPQSPPQPCERSPKQENLSVLPSLVAGQKANSSL